MIERNGGYAAGVFHFVYLFYFSPNTMPGGFDGKNKSAAGWAA
jgi:hypothetical protein